MGTNLTSCLGSEERRTCRSSQTAEPYELYQREREFVLPHVIPGELQNSNLPLIFQFVDNSVTEIRLMRVPVQVLAGQYPFFSSSAEVVACSVEQVNRTNHNNLFACQ